MRPCRFSTRSPNRKARQPMKRPSPRWIHHDYLVRRRAVALLKANGVWRFFMRASALCKLATRLETTTRAGPHRQTGARGGFHLARFVHHRTAAGRRSLTVDNFIPARPAEVLQRDHNSSGCSQLCDPGRRSARRRQRRARLSDSLRNKRNCPTTAVPSGWPYLEKTLAARSGSSHIRRSRISTAVTPFLARSSPEWKWSTPSFAATSLNR